ncbi:MAG: hypothetical protein LBN95_07285 [Prevotellaceae bacterium]|jgi:hypothetical protein|nr:hypothetical protein [Prevotellaceae bacterium]
MKLKYFYCSILLIITSLCFSKAYSQKYKYTKYYLEAGVLGGGSFYLGDVNEKLFANMLPTFGAFVKYKFNGHWEIKLQSTAGQAGIGEFDGKFSKTTFVDVAAIGEFNFFNFAVGQLEPYSSKVAPYIFAGVGASFFNGGVAPIVPFGLGVKYHFGKRWNIGAYWGMTKTLWNDNFDLVDNPLKLNKGMWNNNDWYSTVGVYISINCFEICKACIDGRRKPTNWRR